MRCKVCVGQGEVLGGGFMMMDCRECRGTGVMSTTPPVTGGTDSVSKGLDKRSKSYKQAIRKIADLHPDMSREECEKIFDEEYEKI